jgi:hypothetical protein
MDALLAPDKGIPLDVGQPPGVSVTYYPPVVCPGCGASWPDLDGLGFVACPNCGLCTHPSRTGGVCGLCGDVESLREAAPAVLDPVLSTVQMGLLWQRRAGVTIFSGLTDVQSALRIDPWQTRPKDGR